MRNRWLPYAVVIGAVALMGAWAILRQLTDDTPEPPFSQEQLARAVVLAVRHADVDRFETTLFNLDDLDNFIAAARVAAADSADIGPLLSFAITQRVHWLPYRKQMRREFERVLARADELDARKLTFDGFAADQRYEDPTTGRVIFDRFDIFLRDGDTCYTLEAGILRQTADGWKLSGDGLYLYRNTP